MILFVGKTFVPKGGPELLEAFARVRRAHPAARLAIVASSAPAALPPGATFHGLLGKEALARLYATASIFALPTRREAFGLSFVEAMAFGLPAIGSRIEAIPEIIADGETGLLVPPGDPAALAEAISTLLGRPGPRPPDGRGGAGARRGALLLAPRGGVDARGDGRPGPRRAGQRRVTRAEPHSR